MPPAAISALPISTIKAILFQNHVRLGAGVLEKAELVDRVLAMVDDERQERAQNEARRIAEEEEERLFREERERASAPHPRPTAEAIAGASVHEHDHSGIDDAYPQLPISDNDVNAPPAPAESSSKVEVKSLPSKAQAMAAHLERTGLCVICQVRAQILPTDFSPYPCMCRTPRPTWLSLTAGTLLCVVHARTSSWVVLANARCAEPAL
jgi:hypothetical protein